jgi:hypothetical protein
VDDDRQGTLRGRPSDASWEASPHLGSA